MITKFNRKTRIFTVYTKVVTLRFMVGEWIETEISDTKRKHNRKYRVVSMQKPFHVDKMPIYFYRSSP